MPRSRKVLMGIVVLLAGLAVWCAAHVRDPPFLPEDAAHRTGAGEDACVTCHGPDGSSPRGRSHPVGRDCFRCHAFRRVSAFDSGRPPRPTESGAGYDSPRGAAGGSPGSGGVPVTASSSASTIAVAPHTRVSSTAK